MTPSLLVAVLAGFAGSTPTKVCKDACGYRVGCLTAEVAAEATLPPALCLPPAPKLIPAPPPEPPNPNKTICIDGLWYFERTLTPKFTRGSSSLYVERCE